MSNFNIVMKRLYSDRKLLYLQKNMILAIKLVLNLVNKFFVIFLDFSVDWFTPVIANIVLSKLNYSDRGNCLLFQKIFLISQKNKNLE